METFEFAPKGVCSKKMVLHIEDNKLQKLEVLGGCSGNLQGIQCGMRPTSCPDQLAKAIEAYKEQA